MDASRFDRLSRALSSAGSRRGLLQGSALVAVSALITAPDADARPRRQRDVGVEHFRHRKRWYCLDGESIRRYRRKQEKLLAQGATLGKCSATPPPCVPTTCEALGIVCGSAPDNCGGTLACGACGEGLTCCTGQCVNTFQDNANCGTCGNACDVSMSFSCFGGQCLQPL